MSGKTFATRRWTGGPGTVVGYDAPKDRFQVTLEGGLGTKLLKSDYLDAVPGFDKGEVVRIIKQERCREGEICFKSR